MKFFRVSPEFPLEAAGLGCESPEGAGPDLGEDESGRDEGDLRWDFGARLPE